MKLQAKLRMSSQGS